MERWFVIRVMGESMEEEALKEALNLAEDAANTVLLDEPITVKLGPEIGAYQETGVTYTSTFEADEEELHDE